MIDRITWLAYALLAVIVFLLLAGVIVQAAERDPTRLVMCAMVSRELVRVEVETGRTYSPVMVGEVLHYEEQADPSLKDITPADALKRFTTHRQICEAMIDIMPALPKVDAANNEAWARSIATLAGRFDGVEPAGDPPPPDPGSDEWRQACAAEYRTWDPDTGTVIRKGSPERVRCPCGDEVDCG